MKYNLCCTQRTEIIEIRKSPVNGEIDWEVNIGWNISVNCFERYHELLQLIERHKMLQERMHLQQCNTFLFLLCIYGF